MRGDEHINRLIIVCTFLLQFGNISVMKMTDARKLTHKMLTDLRKRAIASIQDGQSPKEVARVLGIGVTTVYG